MCTRPRAIARPTEGESANGIKQYEVFSQHNFGRRKSQRKLSNVAPVFSEELYDCLSEYFEQERSAGHAVNDRLLAEEVVKLSTTLQLGNFVESTQYIRRWKKRFGVSVRQAKNDSQKAPDDLAEAATAFRSAVTSLRLRHDYTPYNIANMDQPMVRIDIPASRTNSVARTSTVGVEHTTVDGITSRRVRIQRVCQRYAKCQELQRPTPGWGMNLPPLGSRSAYCIPERCPIFIDKARSLAFCFIAKVASTSIKTLFRDLLDITVNNTSNWDELHRAFHYQTQRLGPRTLFMHNGGRGYIKALFVRHPFERLVSTYLDKALRHPCLLDYDFVGKLETADRDFPLFFSEIGVDGRRFSRVHVSRRGNTRCSTGDNGTRTNTESSEDYFATLTRDQVMGLYSRYFYDFELFGYDFKNYLA
ncbi:hypothetical protein HPB50_000477 [Hyalomma asiaticum]|uniref:Uncharacterized protein n=1 Tax=Hyalomma asiaticum TaxID=266040 RepID=A0ACB7SRF5_HYAAI|nr:hypothetical protein HPB50_000477 [Hyalomma asiaticum]